MSSKNQVTLPIATLRQAGITTGDRLRAEVREPGEVTLIRETEPLERFAGMLTGVFTSGELDELRDEWD